MNKIVVEYIKNCRQCQSHKVNRVPKMPMTITTTSRKSFATNFVCVFGCPDAILTDQGSNFMSQVFKELCKDLKIKKLNTSSYHPQTNGALERSHQILANFLRIYTEKDQLNWDTYLPYASFMYNTTPHSSSNFTPYELVFGSQPNLPSRIKRKPQPLYNYDDYSKELKNKLQDS